MENATAPHLVLASQSPIRALILHDAGIRFESRPALVDEPALIDKNDKKAPSEIALNLASVKALAVARQNPEALVIGADQLLVFKGAILQKPVDLIAARKRLRLLSGGAHQLVTGVVLAQADRLSWQHVETARLHMHDLSNEEISHYLEEEGPGLLQSVGAYRLEGPGIRLFAGLEGDYFAMLGLPLVPLLAALRRQAPHLLAGVAPK